MIFESPVKGQKFFAPEVVQTSAMDCGPAALKCLLDGFGIPVNYGRLREACQTSVDGTSINTLEDVAVQLGLDAEQIMIPADHLFLPESQALPALVVTRLPSGLTHFLVIWSRFGGMLQVMDPGTGRRWVSLSRFINELYIHTFPVPAEAWREWAGSEGMLAPLRRRMSDLGLLESDIQRMIGQALADPGWFSLAVLDAATRMVTSITRSKGLEHGTQARNVLQRFYQQNLEAGANVFAANMQAMDAFVSIPSQYWSVQPLTIPGSDPLTADQLILSGAVLVRILGSKLESPAQTEEIFTGEPQKVTPLPPELVAALEEPSYKPFREVLQTLRQDGLLTPSLLILALAMASLSVMIEALLLQGIIRIGQSLTLISQRIMAGAVILAFVLVGLLLEFPISSTVLRMGRRLETRLRVAFLEKIPRLSDRYFHSRLTSDMTQRAHDLRQLRALPNLAVSLLRTFFQLILTTIGVVWLDPYSAPIAIFATILFVALSLFSRSFLDERDLRLRTHIGGLSRFYLDSLLGLIPVRTHSAEHSIRRQHENQLVEWVRSGWDYQRVTAVIQAIGSVLYSLFAIWLVVNYIRRGGSSEEILLLFYWTLNLPALGQSLAGLMQQFPLQRNRILRILEPLSTPDEGDGLFADANENKESLQVFAAASKGVGINFDGVSVTAGGQTILRDIQFSIKPGEHIAIVGPSGAGKSSLVGLLLGWHRPAQGKVWVDRKILYGDTLQDLRQVTAWIDPAVQIWNRSMYDNLRYGTAGSGPIPIGQVVREADLLGVINKLPNGLKTVLGEAGGLVSGGEGQRVRLGRALLRPGVCLVIMDEPFRGLDRRKRSQLLADARKHWSDVTLITITHDVSETSGFPRIIVLDGGEIVEDGNPADLAVQETSHYSRLLRAEAMVREGLWSSAEWRRIWLDEGHVLPPP